MKHYVVGFYFQGQDVLLILKNRPVWQAGQYNGVGGHIEVGETPVMAMAREFLEETGVKTGTDRWTLFLRLEESMLWLIPMANKRQANDWPYTIRERWKAETP